MILPKEILISIDKCVLCWLATVSKDNVPNVSPKEIFTYLGTDTIIIANIASPKTIRNIKANANVCVSFIDILVQKGYQIKGTAQIIKKTDPEFLDMEKKLIQMTQGKFPFASVTKITVKKVAPILAPKYILYPETTEKEQIESAKKAYGF